MHFGQLLKDMPHVARYVEHFYRSSSTKQGHEKEKPAEGKGQSHGKDAEEATDIVELWIVFHYEGMSLQKYLYAANNVFGSVRYDPSKFWRDLRLSANGPEVGKEGRMTANGLHGRPRRDLGDRTRFREMILQNHPQMGHQRSLTVRTIAE